MSAPTSVLKDAQGATVGIPFKIPRTASSTCVISLEDRVLTPSAVSLDKGGHIGGVGYILDDGSEHNEDELPAGRGMESEGTWTDRHRRRRRRRRSWDDCEGASNGDVGNETGTEGQDDGSTRSGSLSHGDAATFTGSTSIRHQVGYGGPVTHVLPKLSSSIRDPARSLVGSLDGDTLINLVVPLLKSFCGHESPTDFPGASVFHGTCVPQISLEDYMRRILKYGKVSHATVVFALIYLDRILANNTPVFAKTTPAIVVTKWNIHRLLLGCIVLAAKYINDEHFNNNHMAAVGGVTNLELNALEIDMAKRLHFTFHVTSEQYFNYENALVPLTL